MNNVATLFDSSQSDGKTLLPGPAEFHRLSMKTKGASPQQMIASYLELYVDDLAKPRVVILIRDLLFRPTGRPLNVSWGGKGVVKLVLVDPMQEMQSIGGSIEVTLE